MQKFTVRDFSMFEKTPISPTEISDRISNLMICTTNVKTQVESINEKTGEYRIVLQGTLNTDQPM